MNNALDDLKNALIRLDDHYSEEIEQLQLKLEYLCKDLDSQSEKETSKTPKMLENYPLNEHLRKKMRHYTKKVPKMVNYSRQVKNWKKEEDIQINLIYPEDRNSPCETCKNSKIASLSSINRFEYDYYEETNEWGKQYTYSAICLLDHSDISENQPEYCNRYETED